MAGVSLGSLRVSVVRVVQVLVVLALAGLAWVDLRAVRATVADLPVAPPPAPPAAATVMDADLATLPLFGAALPVESSAAVASAAASDTLALPESVASYRLFGVLLAPGASERFALIGEPNGAQQAYREGDSAPDGARLAVVREGYVILQRDGQDERLPLAEAEGTGGAGSEGLPAAEDTASDAAPPLAPAASPGATGLKARLRARRAAVHAGGASPQHD